MAQSQNLQQIMFSFPYPSQRFEIVSDEELLDFNDAAIPKNTRLSTNQVVNLYEEWRKWRTNEFPNKTPPPDLKTCAEADILSKALTQFFCEVRTKAKKNYRSDSLRVLYASMNRHLQTINPSLDLFNGAQFKSMKKVVTGKIKELRKHEKAPADQASAISGDDEDQLYAIGKLGRDTPLMLVDTIMYKVGKLFGLRGGEEIRDFRYSNIVFTHLTDSKVKVVFVENQSKTNHRGLEGSSHCPVRGPHVENTGDKDSFFQLVNLYLSKLNPESNLDKSFWFTPLKKFEEDGIWFKLCPIGVNKCKTFVKRLMDGTGIRGRWTNHSLRTTTVNDMQDAGFSDADIMKRTGHRSANSVAKYRRTNDVNAERISKVLSRNHAEPAEKDKVDSSTPTSSNLYHREMIKEPYNRAPTFYPSASDPTTRRKLDVQNADSHALVMEIPAESNDRVNASTPASSYEHDRTAINEQARVDLDFTLVLTLVLMLSMLTNENLRNLTSYTLSPTCNFMNNSNFFQLVVLILLKSIYDFSYNPKTSVSQRQRK